MMLTVSTGEVTQWKNKRYN